MTKTEKRNEKKKSKNDAKQNLFHREYSSQESTKASHEKNTNEEHDSDTFVMEKNVDHKVNEVKNHPTARKVQTFYRVRWYDYSIYDDTWETIENSSRSKLLSCHRLKKIPPPHDIDKAVFCWYSSANKKYILKRGYHKVVIKYLLKRKWYSLQYRFGLIPATGHRSGCGISSPTKPVQVPPSRVPEPSTAFSGEEPYSYSQSLPRRMV